MEKICILIVVLMVMLMRSNINVFGTVQAYDDYDLSSSSSPPQFGGSNNNSGIQSSLKKHS